MILLKLIQLRWITLLLHLIQGFLIANNFYNTHNPSFPDPLWFKFCFCYGCLILPFLYEPKDYTARVGFTFMRSLYCLFILIQMIMGSILLGKIN